MKILLVSTQDYIHHPVPSRHHYIFEELAKRHEVHVPHFHVSRGEERETRLIVHEATRFAVKSPLLHYTLNAPCHFRVIREIIREHDIDVAVGAHVLAGTAMVRAASECDVPVVFDLKDWFPDSAAAYYKNRLLKAAIRRTVLGITKYNLNHSDLITTVSPGLVALLEGYGYASRLITNGVDTDYFRPMDATDGKTRLGISHDSFVIGFAGTVERWYALDDLIQWMPEIIRRHPGAVLLVVGDSLFTDYSAELKRSVAALGLQDHVIFTGTVPYRDLPRYIAAMDVCTIPLSPSQWVRIALPNKFFEYSACGKPILSTPIPDVMEIGGEHLRIYRSRDEFMRMLDEITRGPGTYLPDLGDYSWKRKAEEFEEIFSALVSSRS